MRFLSPFSRSAALPQPDETTPAAPAATIDKLTPSPSTPYTVRVRSSFKSEVIALLTELQAERLGKHGATRRVTEREMLELMLDAYKAVRRNGGASGFASPLPQDVWLGAQAVAKAMQCSPAEALESLVVEKIETLGLAGRKARIAG